MTRSAGRGAPRTAPPTARTAARRGFTLAELMAVIVLLGVVVGGIMTVVVRQQRFYRGAAEIINARRSIREALDVVPMDLRGIAPQLDDITSMTDSSIAFRSQIGSSVTCNVVVSAGTRTGLVIPISPVPGRDGMSSFLSTPNVGDIAFVIDTGTVQGPGDDRWIPYVITAAPVAPAACATTTLTPVGTTGQEYSLERIRTAAELLGGVPITLHTAMAGNGTMVRFARHIVYRLYKSPTDSRWYLGYADSSAQGGARRPLQPVSGPYLPYASPLSSTPSGIRFTYFDSAGTQLTLNDLLTRRRVRRIDIVVRSQSRRAINVPGFARGIYRDSLTVTVAPRNVPQP